MVAWVLEEIERGWEIGRANEGRVGGGEEGVGEAGRALLGFLLSDSTTGGISSSFFGLGIKVEVESDPPSIFSSSS